MLLKSRVFITDFLEDKSLSSGINVRRVRYPILISPYFMMPISVVYLAEKCLLDKKLHKSKNLNLLPTKAN
jgi:hypothetical protein